VFWLVCWYAISVTVRADAPPVGVCATTAAPWRTAGQVAASPLPTRTLVMWEPKAAAPGVARCLGEWSARLPPHDEVRRQPPRCCDDAAATGDPHGVAAVRACAAALHDARPPRTTRRRAARGGGTGGRAPPSPHARWRGRHRDIVAPWLERPQAGAWQRCRPRLPTQMIGSTTWWPSGPAGRPASLDDATPPGAPHPSRPASSRASRKPNSHEHHPARVQNGTGAEQPADHRLQAACGGGPLGVQLGTAAQAGRVRSHRHEPVGC